MKFFKSLTVTERIIWALSSTATAVSFFAFENKNYHLLVGALIGIAALVLVSKGRPTGQVLTVVFAVFYGIVSYSYRYYGEMITYLGMTAPMAVAALASWLKNPYKEKGGEVRVNKLKPREWAIFAVLSVVVTAAFGFVLKALNTNNLAISTLSVLTSFTAAYLTARRSRFYAVCYAVNDAVLIAMWIMASTEDVTYVPVAVCFMSFFVLDVLGFLNWTRMSKKQDESVNAENKSTRKQLRVLCFRAYIRLLLFTVGSSSCGNRSSRGSCGSRRTENGNGCRNSRGGNRTYK